MKVLVTGGSGLIGSVYRKLSKHDAVNLDVAVHARHDILDYHGVLDAVDDAEAVVNLAVSEHQLHAWSVNLLGAMNVAMACIVLEKPCVFATTQYARLPPMNDYGASKRAMEHVLSELPWKYGQNVWVLRFGSVYDDHGGRGVLKAAMEHKDGPFKVVPMLHREFVHVEDVCRAIDISFAQEPPEPPGFAEVMGPTVSVEDVVEEMGLQTTAKEDPEAVLDLPHGWEMPLPGWSPKHNVLSWAREAKKRKDVEVWG